jgi:putative transposase
MMTRAYEYRIYPTEEQETQFKKIIGLNRIYWNICLAEKQQDHSFKIEGYKQIFLKHRPEAYEWSKEVDSTPLAQAWSDITQSFNNFFSSCKKTRKGKFVKPPKFKSKKNSKDSFRFSNISNPRFKDGKLMLTRKLGPIEGAFSCRFCEGKLRNVTFKRTATGKWFVKICVEKKDEPKCKNGKIIGIDWNIHNDEFCVMSDGTKTKSPMYLRRKEVRLVRLQRRVSKKFVKGAEVQSRNYEKAKFQVAKLHEKVAWQRKDFLHKLSRNLANNYEFVAVEDINLQVMASTLHHGKAVGDQGFGMLRGMIAYKTNLVKVPAAYTSQTCSICGTRNSGLTLNDREWDCPVCGSKHDRDINAALNIMRLAVKSTRGTMGSQNACGAPSSAVKQESSKPSAEQLST